jgi:hypothetical protein
MAWSRTMAKAIRLARWARAVATTPPGLPRARRRLAEALAGGSQCHNPTPRSHSAWRSVTEPSRLMAPSRRRPAEAYTSG